MGLYDNGFWNFAEWDKMDWAVSLAVGYALYIFVSSMSLSLKRWK